MPGPSTELVSLALAGAPTDRLEAVSSAPADVAEAIGRTEAMLTPLKDIDPRHHAEAVNRLDEALRPIGAKIAPTIGDEQARAWRAAMVLALSDLPARVAIGGAKDALHQPMRYLNEVEGQIRERAEQHAIRLRLALGKLRAFEREVSVRKLAPPPGYEGGQTPSLTREELRKVPLDILKLGLKNGHISQEDFDHATAE